MSKKKLTTEQKKTIRELYRIGLVYREIAVIFNVSITSAWNAVNNGK